MTNPCPRNPDARQQYYSYDAANNLTAAKFGDGTLTNRGYDRAGRLTNTRIYDAALTTVLARAWYTLDQNGNPYQVSDHVDAKKAVAYDKSDRVVRMCGGDSCTPANTEVSWAYDGVSNRTLEKRAAGATAFSYNAADQLTSQAGFAGALDYVYNTAGQLTQAGTKSYSWNKAGRITSATSGGTTTSFTYDGDGRRLSATTGTAVTKFGWDPLTYELDLERDGAGNTLRRYVHGATPVMTDVPGSGAHYMHEDGIGSILATTKGGAVQWRYDYEPYGVARSTTKVDPTAPENPIQFGGEYRDSGTGDYHLRARQYSPSTGRFVSPDPAAGPMAELSSYLYADANPMVFADPLGLFSIRGAIKKLNKVAKVVATVAGVAAVVSLAVFPPAAPVLGAVAYAAGAVAAGTQIAIAYDTCRGGTKGSCRGAVLSAALWTAAGALAAKAGPSIAGRGSSRAGTGAQSAVNGRNLGRQLASEQQMGEAGTSLAGAGADAPLRAAQRLASEYGGVADDWAKMGSSSYRGSDGLQFETHWYENVRTGLRVEFKTKITGGR